MKTFRIDILEPIWKTKSVGVNLTQCNPDDIVEVHILYTNQQGRRIYPYTYLMKASEVNKYPVRYKGNNTVPLHDVPIADFTVREENSLNFKVNDQSISNNNQNSKTMLFDAKDIQKISEENKKTSGDNRPKIPFGVHDLTVTSIGISTDAKGIPRLNIEFKKDDEHKPSKESMKMSGDNSEIDRSKIIGFFERAFNYLIQPCNTPEDLIKQIKKFEGGRFKGAIQHQKALYTNDNGEVMIVRYVRLWYSGHINETGFSMDIKKGVKELSTKDMDRVIALRDMGSVIRDVDEEKENKAAATNSATPETPITNSIAGEEDPF